MKAKPKTVVYWVAEAISGKNPTLSSEHTEFKFVKKPDIPRLSDFPDFLEMVDCFDKEIRKIHNLQ